MGVKRASDASQKEVSNRRFVEELLDKIIENHAEKKTIVPTKFKTPEEHLEDLLIFFPQCKEIRKTSRVGEKYQVNFIPNYQSKEEYENQLLLKIMHEKKEIKKNTTTPILTRAKTAESQKIITTEEENEKK